MAHQVLLIWGNFNMTRPPKSHTNKKASWLNRTVLSWLCISFLGWLILLLWSLMLWINKDFETAYVAVKNLTVQQAAVVPVISTTSYTQALTRWIDTQWRKQSNQLTQQAQDLRGNLVNSTTTQRDALISHHPDLLAARLPDFLNSFWLKAQEAWILLCATGQLLFIKLTILMTAIPLFLLAITAGLIDGLNQRAIRTACLGRESTYVFHKTIPFARKALFCGLGFWLAIPHALPPSPIFVCVSVLLSLVVSVSASRFKKYL